MIRIAIIAGIAGLLSMCGNQGSHTGQVLKDCAVVPASDRGKVAKEIEDMSRDAAIKKIASLYNATEAAAAECLKK